MLYDLIVLGAGPAGLTAGLYGARAKLKTLVIEKGIEGGQISNTTDVENYPGTPNISGFELSHTVRKQAESFGAEFVSDEVIEADLKDKIKKIKTKEKEYEAKTVIIATGATPRKLGFPGEDIFEGRGISYCATCDAAFYQDFDVYVIGGGDSAVDEALFISKFAKKVYIVHRRDELRAAKSLQDRAFSNEKIDFIWDSVVEEIKGDKIAEELVLRNLKTGELTSIKQADGPFGIFIFVGFIPETQIFEGQIEMEKGYIKTDEDMNTNIEGVFAAGDLRVKNLRQVVTATADGAIAAVNAEKYIAEQEGTVYKAFEEKQI
ncbi:thioredoxin-disulfide reductase [Anaerosphaera multitolerans]|uniref:Thioredoxin reductase n=1 Tax=Anaerosphaera multitolerans TaxID=2487351 RepID=A0A437S6G6_9FIRM|nr:thioredoxin-disulfide reductase [Anaerosphaera multitolerans]RVU54587.1 thioredoxin-disulfide reductase [Anaerosphaera multitolerans]